MEGEHEEGKTPAGVAPAVLPGGDPLIETDDLTWENAVEKSKKPVAVMFYSPTCVFCHQMEPYFRSYAGEYRDSVIFVRLNILKKMIDEVLIHGKECAKNSTLIDYDITGYG